MDKKRKTNKKLDLSTPKKKSHPSNSHVICDKEVVIQLERLRDSVVAELTAGGSTLPPEQAKKKLKLSTRKTKSCPSNPPFICDKEVVIQLERLSDSVVTERTAGGSALPPEQVIESNDDALDINSLPNEIILKVFAYLKQSQLSQIARVCSRWNELTKCSVLWKKVNVKISPSHRCQTTVAESFINTLPSCVTSLRLDFTEYNRNQFASLDFEELCLRLQEKCPHLEELILIHSVLSNSLSSVMYLCSQFLQDVENLIFHYSHFGCDRITDRCSGISKIKILELFNCYVFLNKSPFSKMPHLKQLHLFNTLVHDSWFEDDTSFLNQLHVLNVGYTHVTASAFPSIQNHGRNLKELYLCSVDLEDHDLNFNNSVFPYLKIICLSGYLLTCEGVVSLIQSCPSLEIVYVNLEVAESFAAHPFVVANRYKSGIVKVIDPIHDHNVDYSHSEF